MELCKMEKDVCRERQEVSGFQAKDCLFCPDFTLTLLTALQPLLFFQFSEGIKLFLPLSLPLPGLSYDTSHFCPHLHTCNMECRSSCRSQPGYCHLIHIFRDPLFLGNVRLLNCTVLPCILFIALTKFVHISKCVSVGGYTHTQI